MAGVTYTDEELARWIDRRTNGYTRPTPLPDTVALSKARADSFVANPSQDYITFNPYTNGADPYGEFLISSAWEYLCTGNLTYGNPVHDHMVNQVQEPAYNWSSFAPNGVNADGGTLAAGGDNITFAAAWVSKLFTAFDYTRDLYTSGELGMIRQWFYDAAIFFQRSSSERTQGLLFKFRSDNGKYNTVSAMLADQANQETNRYYYVLENNRNYQLGATKSANISNYTPRNVAIRQHFTTQTYISQAAMIADQGNHVAGQPYDYNGITFGYSYVYRGTTAGTISDYKYQRIYDVLSYFNYVSPVKYTHLNFSGVSQNQLAGVHNGYNNRTALWPSLLIRVGLEMNDEFMIDQAKLWHEESIMFGVFPDGTNSEYRRNGDYSFSATGTLAYAIIQMESFFRTALMLRRHRNDSSLFTFTTNKGMFGSEGGSKNIRLWIETVIEHLTTPHENANARYYSSVTFANLINAREITSNRRHLAEVVLSLANRYFREDRIKDTYLNTIAGSDPYTLTDNYATGGVGHAFGGALGEVPDFITMEYEMEDVDDEGTPVSDETNSKKRMLL